MAEVQPIPEGMHTVTPHLICEGAAAAIEFYKQAFGAVEISRQDAPGGKMLHATIRIGDSTIFLADAAPEEHLAAGHLAALTPGFQAPKGYGEATAGEAV